MTTPELNLLTETTPDVLRHIGSGRIIVFIGNPDIEIGEVKTGCKCLFVPNFEKAIQAIREVMTFYKKGPSLIIHSYNGAHDSSLAAWQQYLKVQPALCEVPFFLYAETVSEIEYEYIRKYNYIDEIITRDCLNLSIHQKITFVSKYKKLAFQSLATGSGNRVNPERQINAVLKRMFDILVAGSLLLLLSPIFLLIAIIIKLESRGPVFYAARRAGKNYQVFKFYKFRTMVADADKKLQQLSHMNQYQNDSGPVFYKVSNDPRITKFGSFLRNTSIDEMPQLFNVLIGDMSLVGNRPLPLYEATALTTDDWAQRFLAPAGITGLWQISKRGNKEMSANERIELDINYSRKHTFAYDMWIMINTPKALVQKDNV
jgi:lipopolysaccharide/colanic/teichoic acid biosynthesis glycosyltransferase